MPLRLYLDTARLGLASRRVQRAHRDFARLASEEGLTLYASRLLMDGFDACPQPFQRRYSGLSDWHGIARLKSDLSKLAFCESDSEVMLASRSSQLMKLSARLLFQRCRRVLTTDLTWPGYAEILERERIRISGETIRIPLRHSIQRNGLDAHDVTARVASYCRQFDCDGLFLPTVSHDGIRLPIKAIVKQIRSMRELRFVVVDGAQAFCHTTSSGELSGVDLYVAGAHKWLRGMHPLGIAVLSNSETQSEIREFSRDWILDGQIDDSLLCFTEQLAAQELPSFTETVNTLPLFTAGAAVIEVRSTSFTRDEQFAIQLENADLVAEVCCGTAWQPIRPAHDLRSGILLLRHRINMGVSPDEHQAHFRKFGVAVTAYSNGWLRLAMPQHSLTDREIVRLRKALTTAHVTETSASRFNHRWSDAVPTHASLIPAVM